MLRPQNIGSTINSNMLTSQTVFWGSQNGKPYKTLVPNADFTDITGIPVCCFPEIKKEKKKNMTVNQVI